MLRVFLRMASAITFRTRHMQTSYIRLGYGLYDTLPFPHVEFKTDSDGQSWLITDSLSFFFSACSAHLLRHTVVVDLQSILLFVVVWRNNHPDHNNNLTYKQRWKGKQIKMEAEKKESIHLILT